jgi:hypothetical protein
MEEKQLTLNLTAKEIAVILEGLNELPRKKSEELFVKIHNEALTQLKPKDPK